MMSTNQHEERYCLFRSRGMDFAVPAQQVREVCFPPAVVRVPAAPPLLAGICHFRNEFVPVLQWPTVKEEKGASSVSAQLLIFDGQEGPWALQVDQVAGLEFLEITPAAETGRTDREEEMIVGWATHRHQSVRLIDSEMLYQTACRLLRDFWRTETISPSVTSASLSSC